MSQILPFLSNEQLLEVFNSAKTATAIHITEDAIIQTANDAMLQIWGKDRSVIGKSLEDALPELKGQPFIDLFKKVWREGITVSGTDTPANLNVDGRVQTFYFDFEYRAIKDTGGQTLCILHTAMDVTERFLGREELADVIKREYAINEELRRSEQKLDDILNQLPSPVVILRGPEQVIEIANQSILSFWKKEREEVIGRPMLEVFPELKTQPFPAQWKHVFETGESIINKERPVYFTMADGHKRLSYVDYYYQPIGDAESERSGVLATVLDVSHKVEARRQLEENQIVLQKLNEELSAINEEMVASNEELISTNEELSKTQENLHKTVNELAESETRFRSLIEQSPVAIALFRSHDLIIDIVNDQMLEVWGKAEDIKGKELAIAMPELTGQPFIPILKNVFTSGEPFYGYESKAFVVRKGELVEGYFNFICQPIKDDNGKIVSVLQVVTEVTEQVTIRLELQKTEEMMRFAIEAAKLGSWHIHPVTKTLTYNSTLARIFGYEGKEPMTYEQAIGQVTEEYRTIITDEIQKAIGGEGDYDITYSQIRFNDGELIWLRSLGKISMEENGELITFSGFVMDITELKKDEERKNDFIGMVSHELKTPLTSLNGYIQLLQNKAKKANDSFTIGALDVAGKQVKKMTSMINGFLNISRLESGKIILNKSSFSLDVLVNNTIEETIVMDSSHNITFSQSEPINIFADYDKISNVISNLLSNAVKYAPNNREIEVKCKVVGNTAQISVRDEGMGISKEDLEKLFERYYRVESNNTISGFGIGLYLSAEIIERHNGKIWAESEQGKGSEFYFSLPLA